MNKKNTENLTVTMAITLDFGTKMNRRRPLSWGKGPSNQPLEFHKMVPWDIILEESIEWTHMVTINIDPKIPNFQNDPKILKTILKSFFIQHSRLFSKLALVIEEGRNGKWHAHALIKTFRAPTFLKIMVKQFSKNQNLDGPREQKAIVFQRINDHYGQNAEYTWIGCQMGTYPDRDEFPTHGWPYLRKEIQNHSYCYFYKGTC